MKKNLVFYFQFSILLIALTLVSCGKSERAYTISGTLPSDVDAEWIYIYSAGMEPVAIDSVRIKDGTFCFNGVAPDTVAFLILHPGSLDEYPAYGWNLFLEPGEMVVDSDAQFVTGTPLNDGLESWMSDVYSLMMMGGGPEEVVGTFDQYWPEHNSDFLGGFMLASLSQFLDPQYVDSLAATVPAEIKQYHILKPFFDQVEAMSKMKPGQLFEDVELVTLDGTPARLSEYIGKGKYVLVDFWASWCGPCRQAIPELQNVVKKYKELQVLGIAVSDEVEDTQKAIDVLGIKWPVLSDKEGKTSVVYGFSAIPTMILFAPDGTIAARDFMLEDIESLISAKS